jgi:hypothetical protein
MISPEKIAEMLAAAEKATPGPWGTDDPHIVFSATGGAVVYLAGTRGLDTAYPQAVADATYIALCDPETITEILSELLTLRAERDKARHGVYIASKTKHADRWRFLRDKVGLPIISTWIDEAGAGESHDLSDLWDRCIREASTAQHLILYREPDEVLKGGWIELGAALASGVTVFAVGIGEFTVAHDRRIQHFRTMKEAVAALPIYARSTLSPEEPSNDTP